MIPTIRLLTFLLIMSILTAALAGCETGGFPVAPTSVASPSPRPSEALPDQPTIAATNVPTFTAAINVPTPTTAAATLVDTNTAKPEDATQARLRVSQCVFGQPKMDVYLDGKVPIASGIPLSYVPVGDATRYEYLQPGTHSVAVVPMSKDTSQALLPSMDVPLAAGHRYTLVVLGQRDDTTSHKGLLIDETEAYQAIGAKPTDARHITVNNLKGAAGIDFSVNDTVTDGNVPYGGYKAAIWPTGTRRGFKATVSGAPDSVLLRDTITSFGAPGVDTLECFGGTYPGKTEVNYGLYRSSSTTSLNTIDFLQAFTEAAVKNGSRPATYNTFLSAVKTAGLSDMLATGGPYVVFVPTDLAFFDVSKEKLNTLMADPKALGEVLRRHIVEGYYPPNTLITGQPTGGFNRTVTNMLGETLKITGQDALNINGSSMGEGAGEVVIAANGTRLFYQVRKVLLTLPGSK